MTHIPIYSSRDRSHEEDDVVFFQAEDSIRDIGVTGVQTCALPISEERVAHGQELADGAGEDPERVEAGRERVDAAHGQLAARRGVPDDAAERRRPHDGRGGSSHERSVGKECRSRWQPYLYTKNRTK